MDKYGRKIVKDGAAIHKDAMAHRSILFSKNQDVLQNENQYRKEFKRKFRTKRQASNKNKTNAARPKMATSSGAGQSMGLTLVLNADKNKYFMTSAFFEGFKVIIEDELKSFSIP